MSLVTRRRVLRVCLAVDVFCAVLCLGVLAVGGPRPFVVAALLVAGGAALLAAAGARRGGRS